MKAIVHDTYGAEDVLEYREIAVPEIGDSDVLVRVHAAGIDAGVRHLMTGLPYLLRVMGFGVRRPKFPILGMELAGTVESVGRHVTRFHPGDEVFGACNGSFAEFARAEEKDLVSKPSNLTFEQAAALAISGTTALQSVCDVAKVQAGQSVLILGAAGGVGTFAVQIAKALGAQVTGVCSTTKTELVRSIGADHVIDYTREDFAGSPGAGGPIRYDVILDTAGNRPLRLLRRALTQRGTLVIVGGDEGGPWLGGTERLIRAALWSPFLSQDFRFLFAAVNRERLESLSEFVKSGRVAPVIDRTFPLRQVPQAIRYLRENRARGKVVVVI